MTYLERSHHIIWSWCWENVFGTFIWCYFYFNILGIYK